MSRIVRRLVEDRDHGAQPGQPADGLEREVRPLPTDQVLEELRFREGARGANVWFIEPNDPTIFNHVEKERGVPCVSVVQTYLDLLRLAERADEAAEQIRANHLVWKGE